MIKHKGNINEALKELNADKNNSVSYIYPNPTNGEGIFGNATITLKDVFATKDMPTQSSSRILENFTPNYDAEIVRRLKNEGAAILAKVHCDELALGGTGEFSSFGLITNPLDSTRMVGGSSSGSVATFTDSISVAFGSDTGDSVRLPASYTGIIGYKPSYGAISRYGLFAFASSLDTVGYFAHNIEDIITTSQVLFGKDEKDFSSVEVAKPVNELKKPKKVGVLKIEGTPDYADKAIEKLINKLKDDDVEVNEIIIDPKLLNLVDIVYDIISYAEVSSNDANLTGIVFGQRKDGASWDEIMINSRTKGLGNMVQRRLALGSYFLLSENQEDIFIKAQKIRRLISDKISKELLNVDIMINPASTIAPKLSEGKEDNTFTSILTAANFIGLPNIVLPFAKHNSMPFGLSIASSIYEDKQLLSYSLYIEKLIGGDHE